jgi:hypothetical protein
VSEDVKKFYPAFHGIEHKMRATPVHLQIYDGKAFVMIRKCYEIFIYAHIDAAHILPNLFPFTTPAKFSVRAITSFIRHVTHTPPKPVLFIPSLVTTASVSSGSSGSSLASPSVDSSSDSGSDCPSVDLYSSEAAGVDAKAQERYRMIASLSQATTRLRGRSAQIFRFGNEDLSVLGPSSRSSSWDDSHYSEELASQAKDSPVVLAGGRAVYEHWVRDQCDVNSPSLLIPHMKSGNHRPMIRERVSTQGIIRTLEHEEDLPAFRLSPQLVGVIPEIVLERYMVAKRAADQRFASTIKGIEKARVRNIERASRDLAQRAAPLRRYFRAAGGSGANGGAWRLGWTLDVEERPPPSSIVGRLDTEEALRFARAADRRWLSEPTAVAGGGGGQGLRSSSSSSWRSAGAAAMKAVWFTTKLQRTGIVESRADIDRSIEV